MDSRQHDSSSALAIASFTISLAVHVGGVAWFAHVNPHLTAEAVSLQNRGSSTLLVLAPLESPPLPPPPPKPLPLPPPPPEPPKQEPPASPEEKEPEVHPGIEQSDAKTENWLGFKEATEHRAMKSIVEQSALSPLPGLPMPRGAANPSDAREASRPQNALKPAQGIPQPTEPERAPAETVPPVPQTQPSKPTPNQEQLQAPKVPLPEREVTPSDAVSPAKQLPPEASHMPEATGDGREKAPKTDQPEGVKRESPAPAEAPKESVGKAVEPNELPDAKPSEGVSPRNVEGSSYAKPGSERHDTADKPGLEVTSEDPRALGEQLQEKRLEERAKPEQAPHPLSPREGDGPAATPAEPPKPQMTMEDVIKVTFAPNAAPPTLAASPSDSTTGAVAQAAGAPATGRSQGTESEAESVASALEEAVDIRPGQVRAVKGLQIKTVRPEWSITTRLRARPKDAVVRVVFGRSGKVLRAEFVEGQTTGWPEVDEPLREALYRWTASGEALKKLPPTPPPLEDGRPAPQKGVALTFRMILGGSDPMEK